MALIFKGNLSFKLQTGASGPTPDRVFNLPRRQETWQGKQADLVAFLAIRPLGSAHPTWPYLKLENVDPRYLEAGMVDVVLSYCGSELPGTEGLPSFTRLYQQQAVAGQYTRTFEAPEAYTTFQGASIYLQDVTYRTVIQDSDAESSIAMQVPAVTFHYARPSMVTTAQFETRANEILGTLDLIKGNPVTRQTGQTWVTRAGYLDKGSDILNYNLTLTALNRTWYPRNISTTFAETEGGATGLAVRETDFRCDPIGGSGWYEIEETWEKSYALS